MFTRLSYNNMINKGWDSAAQESYCWQKFVENGESTDPDSNQFWWVPRVWELHGHAPDYDSHTRNDKGRFVKFPPGKGDSETTASTKVRLLRLATTFSPDRASEALQLISLAEELDR